MSETKRPTKLAVLILTAVALGLVASCAPKSKSFKLAAPTAAKHVLVAAIDVTPDGEHAEQAEPAFSATAQYVATGIAQALRDNYGGSGITAEVRETPGDLPFIYQRRILKGKTADDWMTFFQAGNYGGTLEADPSAPKTSVPFPVVEFPEDWKSDADAALFVFVHFAALSGTPPTDLIEDVPEDYDYASVVGYVLIDTSEGRFLGSGHRTEEFDQDLGVSDAAVEAVDEAMGVAAPPAGEVEVPVAEDAAEGEEAEETDGSPLSVDGTPDLAGYLFPGEEVMNQVVMTTLLNQITAIAAEIGLQLTLTE